jgi:hypothetical protein
MDDKFCPTTSEMSPVGRKTLLKRFRQLGIRQRRAIEVTFGHQIYPLRMLKKFLQLLIIVFRLQVELYPSALI